jgi:hypothetical protein
MTTKDQVTEKLHKSSEEKERGLRAQLAEIQSKTKQRMQDLVTQVEQLQTEAARRVLEVQGLTEALAALTHENNENKVSIFIF